MAFPVKTVIRPAALRGQSNGRIATAKLVEVPSLRGGPTARLLPPAARAWRALRAAARADGHLLLSLIHI